MGYLPISGLEIVEESEAPPTVARIYGDIKRNLQYPFVPNIVKALGSSPSALALCADLMEAFEANVTLPQSLVSMILYTIAERRNCEYCSAAYDLSCRTLGIDEGTISALIEDLESVHPRRVRAIIEFAVKVAHHPQTLVAEDYDSLRDEGISEEELAEIILIAAYGNLTDTVADALKIPVDTMVAQALGRT